MLMSVNGYGVVCTLDNEGGDVTFHAMPYADAEGHPILPVDDSGPADPDRYRQVFPRCSTLGGSGVETCDAVGVILGLPHRHRIEVRIGRRFVTVATTEHGAFAYEFRARSANVGDEQVRVVAPDGGVVWSESRDHGGPEGGGDGVRQEDGSGVYKLP